MTDQLPTQITATERLLSAAEFQHLADVPPEVEWFANITNRSTRKIHNTAPASPIAALTSSYSRTSRARPTSGCAARPLSIMNANNPPTM